MTVRDDAGVTLVELLVTIALMSVIAVITGAFVTSASTFTARATNHVQAEQDVMFVLRRMTQDLRAANPISVTYPSTETCAASGSFPADYSDCLRVVVTNTVDPTTTCQGPDGTQVRAPYVDVTYGLVNGELRADKVEYDSSCSEIRRSEESVLLRNVTNTGPLFSYFDAAGTPLANGVFVTQAASVRINLEIEYQQQGDPQPLRLSSHASFRNNR